MTWLKLIPHILAIAGGVSTYISIRVSNKRKDTIESLSGRLASISQNLQALRDADIADSQANNAVVSLNQEIKNAKTDKDAERIRNEFVDSAYGGLRNLYGSRDNPAG